MVQIGEAHILYFRVFDPTASAQTGLTTSLQPPGTEVHPLMSTYLCFRLANMLLLKEELTVQVADINGVQVNLPKSRPSTKVVTDFDATIFFKIACLKWEQINLLIILFVAWLHNEDVLF